MKTPKKKETGNVVISQEKINALHNIRVTSANGGKPDSLQSVVDKAIGDFIRNHAIKNFEGNDNA